MTSASPPQSPLRLWDITAASLEEHLEDPSQADSLLRNLHSILHRAHEKHLLRNPPEQHTANSPEYRTASSPEYLTANPPECCIANSPEFGAWAWRMITREVLGPFIPWPIHELLYNSCFCDWDFTSLGPPPAWTPNPGSASETNIGLVLRDHGKALLGDQWGETMDPSVAFPILQRISYDHPEAYWKAILSKLQIVFHQKPRQIVDFDARDDSTNDALPGGRWLPGASLNIAESCLHPTADGKRADEKAAVVWQDEASEGNDARLKRRSLADLRQLAYQIAAGLVSLGLGHGAALAVYLPMTLDSVAAYLGILLAGSTVVSVAESFSAAELSSRLKIAGAKGIFTQDVMVRGGKVIPLYRQVVEADAPQAIVLAANCTALECSTSVALRPMDVLFSDLLSRGKSSVQNFTPPALPADHPCNILFSSGTTGTPKAIPWSQVTPIKAAADALMHQDVRPGDVVAWPTSLGWMMGPWLIFGSLVNGATLALYQGNPGTAGFLRFVQDARVTVLGVIPSLVRAWKAISLREPTPFDWTSVRVFSSTGEASTPSDALWLMSRSAHRAPILEYCGGTEIGGAFVTGTLVQPQALSCFSTAAMGCRLVILDEDTNAPQPEGKPCMGECALMPHMLGASWKLLNADNFAVYFKGMPTFHGQVLRRHGDAFEQLPRGYFRAHGRTDDTMNLGGIKVSSVEIERVCNLAHPAVIETAAIGVPPAAGGPEELVVFAVLQGDNVKGEGGIEEGTLRAAFTERLRKKLNPLFKVSRVCSVKQLPRTATNKVLRRQLRDSLKADSLKADSLEADSGRPHIARPKL